MKNIFLLFCRLWRFLLLLLIKNEEGIKEHKGYIIVWYDELDVGDKPSSDYWY